MKKIAWLLSLLCMFSLFAPTLAQGEAFPLPTAVQALLKAQFPDHTLTSFSGFRNEESGQFALVVSRAGAHRLADLEGYLMTKYLAFGWDMDQVTPAFPLMTGRDELLENSCPSIKTPVRTAPSSKGGRLPWAITTGLSGFREKIGSMSIFTRRTWAAS